MDKKIIILLIILIITTIIFNGIVMKTDNIIDLSILKVKLLIEQKKSQELFNTLSNHLRDENDERRNSSPLHDGPYYPGYLEEWYYPDFKI
jgi:uncharacterized protein YxeA